MAPDNRFWSILVLLALTIVWAGCEDSMLASRKSSGSADYDYGGNYADTAGGGYMASDADADADMGEEDSDPAGWESTAKYTEPMGAGRYVFVPDEARDSVVVVDSETLLIRVVEVGSRPTHMVTLEEGERTRVAVINLNSDEVTVIEMDSDENFTTWDIPVRPDTNFLAASPDGRYIVAYHDPELTAVSGAPSTDQEISILTVESGEAEHRSVGMHPWKVVYDDAVTRAFVVTEGGISVIDFDNLDAGRADPVSIFESGSYNSGNADIEITRDGSVALGRISDVAQLRASWLDGSGTQRVYDLPGIPMDLDIAEDGSFGMMVIRSLSQVAFFDLPLPESPTEDPFTYVDLPGKVVDTATLSRDGEHALLYTVVAGTDEDMRRLTLMSRSADGWDIDSAVLERRILSVETVDSADDGTRTAVVTHQYAPYIGVFEKPYAYSLVTIPNMMPKLQQLATPPGKMLLTPDGDFGFLLLREANEVEKINLNTLIVNGLDLSSPPVAAGYAGDTDKVYVAQDHPSGRMTFFGVRDNSINTITGYNLNEDIEVSDEGGAR